MTYLKKAQASDAERMVLLRDAAFHADFVRYGFCPGYGGTPQQMRESIERYDCYIICKDGEAVGMVSTSTQPDGTQYLGCLCVVPALQGHGIGYEANKQLEALYPNAKGWFLETPADKYQNHHFYEKCGYAITRRYYHDTVECVEMRKPLRVLTAAEIRAAEDEAVKGGASYAALMENAGRQAAQSLAYFAQKHSLTHHVHFLCGRGNNAGDAFVAARYLLAEGWRAELTLLCGEPTSPLALQNIDALPDGAVFLRPGESSAAAITCDGVFGIGFHGKLPHGVRAALEKANRADTFRAALDIPSGMDSDTGICAEGCYTPHATLTFGAYKPSLRLAPERCGETFLLDIGL